MTEDLNEGLNIDDEKEEQEEVKTVDKKKNKKTIENELKKELEILKEELLNQSDKAVRANAELLNYKKRKDEEVFQNNKYANKSILLNILSIVDNFESGLKMEKDIQENNDFLEGFKLIYNQMLEILKTNEVVEISAMKKVFDPTLHQAVMTKMDEKEDANIVLEVFQKGYMYKDRLLRASMVVVNNLEMKGKEENE